MSARAVSRAIENMATSEQRWERSARMDWRIRRYGFACLTPREAEAMQHEMDILRRGVGLTQYDPCEGKMFVETTGLLKQIAARMGVSFQWVSKLLKRASEAMMYFAEHDIYVGWQSAGGFWRLHAPVAKD